MEHKQFTSDDSNHSPYSHEGFQADRFTKTTNNVNIPDTIIEQYSAESIGEMAKMEGSKVALETYDSGENKENVSYNQQVINNKSLSNSENLAIDSLYIKQCEKKLLESSFSDEEKNSEFDNKGSVNKHLQEIQSYSVHHNDTISTPPSLLRKEISMLRKEMAEAHEFHDFEIKVLREERSLDGVDSEKYIQLFEKYLALVELYSNLKTELDEYRKNQESVRNELQSKTADYLESLCSQIESSDNSLNFSSSFISFGGGVRNSTMMGEASEMEATVLHDGTVLANDPLSITVENSNGTFKTPLQTPLRSAKKLFPAESSSSVGKMVAETKDLAVKRDLTIESDYNIHLLNLETAFYDKVKEVEDLEQRLFKVEDMSLVLHGEFERITSVYEKDNIALKKELSVKTEQLNDLMQKLFTETISLNPSLKDSLIDIPGTKLLAIFLETIMENCKKIKDDNHLTTIENLRNQLSSQETKLTELEMLKTTCEDLKAKLANASSTISTRDEEIKMLQSHVTNIRQTRDDLASANERLLEFDSKMKTIEAEKTAAENKYKDLEKLQESLSLKFEGSQTELASVQEEKSQIEKENIRLKESHDFLKIQVMETEDILKSRESEIIALKENLLTAESSLQQLQSQLKCIEDEKAELHKVCQQLQEKNETLQEEITTAKNIQIMEMEEILKSRESEIIAVKEYLTTAESSLQELQSQITSLENEKAELHKICQQLQEKNETLQEAITTAKNIQVMEMENILKSRESEIITVKENLLTAESSLQELQSQLKSIEDEKTELQKVCQQLQEKNESLREEITTAKNIQVTEMENILKSRESEIISVKENLLTTESSLQELQSQLKSMEDEKAELRKVCQQLQEKNESLQEQITTAKNIQIMEMEDILKSRESEIIAIKEYLKTAETSLQELQSHLKSIEDEKAELHKVCQQLQEKNESLQEEITTAKNIQIMEMEDILKSRESEIISVKENLLTAESSLQELQSQLKYIEDEKTELHKVCQQLQEKNESLQDEIMAAKKLENNPDFEKIQTENDYLKLQILEFEKHLAELRSELENAKKDEIDALMQEVEEVKNEKLGLSKSLENLERGQKLLSELLIDLGSDSDLPCVGITNLIQKVSLEYSLDSRETKIMSGFLETITKLCKNVQNELIKNFESKKSEWEEQRNVDLKLIKSLEDDLKLFGEKRDEEEARLKEILLEKEDLMKVHENLKNQIVEAERMLSSCNEEISSLKSQETIFKKAKDDLSEAEELVERLNNELLLVKAEKTATEDKYRDLETIWTSLSLKFEESQTQLASAQEEKTQMENENILLKESHESLKVRMTETETILKSRECEIITVKENLLTAESSLQQLQYQLKSIEYEKAELHKVCQQLEEKNGSLHDEIKAAKKLENNPDYEKVQTENDYLKQEILESEKRLVELKMELENARMREVEELMRKVEEVKKEKLGFSKSLENVERSQEFLADLLSEPGIDSDWPFERIAKLIENASALKESSDPRETKIVSGFVETITKTCKNVQNELVREFEGKQIEWEEQRNLDLELIKSLENELKVLREKRDEEEARLKEIILEKEDLMSVHEDLKNEMMETERIVSSYKEQINSLKIQEEVFKKTKDDLFEAEEVIERLNGQLLGVKAEKTAAEDKYRGLETIWETLSLKLEESQTQLASAQEEKTQIENENILLKEFHDSLKVQIKETEALLKSRECEIITVKENLLTAESSLQELQSHLKAIEDEKTELHKVCQQLQEKNESLQDEITAAKTLENNPVFEKIQTENDYLKQEILESEKRLVELKMELENARMREIEELLQEVEGVKKEKLGFSKSLENLERGQKLLAELLTDLGSDSDLPCVRITNLIQKVSLEYSLDSRETKIMSGFLETITKICKNVQNELIKNFEVKKSEWEEQRNVDLKLIKSLEDDIMLLREKKNEGETRIKEIILEKEDLMKVHENLKNQMVEAERMLSRCNEEIHSLKSQETIFKKAKDDLSEAQEVIARLSDQLLAVKAQKSETEQRYRELQDGVFRTEMDGLKAENKNLKLGNDSLRDRVKELTKIIEETAGSDLKEDLSNTSTSFLNGMNLRSRSVKRTERYARRLDKLEEINHNLTELVIRILTATEYPDLEKLNLSSVRDFPKTMKKVLDHLNGFLSKMNDLKEENSQLDEECETYSNIIKDLKKEAANVWKTNTEKTEAMEAEIARLNEEKCSLEKEKQDLLAKLSRLNDECQKLQSSPKTEDHHTCICGNDSKKVTELKRIILMKEQKLLELQDVEEQTSTLKSQIEYLKTALEREKKKAAEEKEKNKKLQNQLKEATKSEKKSEDTQVLEELRMRGSVTGGIVQEFGDKEKMRKLSKDIGILKELCRARYAEIKRLEAVNAALRNATPKHPATPKNLNQMDSPIRSRGYNTRSKHQVRDLWKTEIIGKENGGV